MFSFFRAFVIKKHRRKDAVFTGKRDRFGVFTLSAHG